MVVGPGLGGRPGAASNTCVAVPSLGRANGLQAQAALHCASQVQVHHYNSHLLSCMLEAIACAILHR